jgi:hypothetical protein
MGYIHNTFISYLTQYLSGFGNAYFLIYRIEKGAKAIQPSTDRFRLDDL